MRDLHWSITEKKLARRVFDEALRAELAEVIANFKARAAAVSTLDEMWDMQDFLDKTRIGLDWKYDYRYSQLIRVFATLIREGRITEEQLHGLSEEKLMDIRLIASL